MKNHFTKSALSKSFFILLTLSSFSSYAECTYNQDTFDNPHQRAVWQQLISSSQNQVLRQAWLQGQCHINKGPHFGGQPPPGGDGATLHVTVRYSDNGQGHTCHVFHQLNPQNQNLTTCN